ncbi:hypothetical protein [Lichenicoccus sp.]
MIEPLIEAIGCVIGLGLLLYFQVWRPSRRQPDETTRKPTPPSE